jgi:hypothetical protein
MDRDRDYHTFLMVRELECDCLLFNSLFTLFSFPLCFYSLSLSLSLSLSFFLYFALSNMAEQTDKKELKKQKKTKQHKKNNIKQKHRRPCSLTTSNTINNTAGVSTTW